MVSYLELDRKEFERRIEEAFSLLEDCRLCGRECGVNRLKGEKGACRTGREVIISSFGPHFGEESPLVGRHGSGTIFFTNCNLSCVYCQNYTISQLGEGEVRSEEALANIMIYLQRIGCHNINLVSPTHVMPQILKAIFIAMEKGLRLPIVYNTGGYDSIETIKLLEGIVDIYMPDMKYSDPDMGLKYSKVKNYPEVNRVAVKEMHRQVGDLVIKDGIATRGLLIRHLVLPNGIAGTEETLKFIAEEISKNTYVNIMDQYRPAYKAHEYPELSRGITGKEFKDAIDLAKKYGLTRLDKRHARFLLI